MRSRALFGTSSNTDTAIHSSSRLSKVLSIATAGHVGTSRPMLTKCAWICCSNSSRHAACSFMAPSSGTHVAPAAESHSFNVKSSTGGLAVANTQPVHLRERLLRQDRSRSDWSVWAKDGRGPSRHAQRYTIQTAGTICTDRLGMLGTESACIRPAARAMASCWLLKNSIRP